MNYCVEATLCHVFSPQIESFIEENKVRRKKMVETVPGCLDVVLLLLPFLENTFLLCVVWQTSKEEAMKYAGERFQREGYRKFLAEHVKDHGIFFIDGIDLSESARDPSPFSHTD